MALAFRSPNHHDSRSGAASREDLLKALETKFPASKSIDDEPAIPTPDIFASLLDDDHAKNEEQLPRIAECAVHLRMLEAFLVLKQKVATSNALDRAFGIAPKDTLTTVCGKRCRKTDTTFKERRKVKWNLFVRMAAWRFLDWWKGAVKTLPPLDVLMVWHAFLLNHSAYRNFCMTPVDASQRLAKEFPWKEIHNALQDDKERFFNVSSDVESTFSDHHGPFDLFKALSDHDSHSMMLKDALEKLASSPELQNDLAPAMLYFNSATQPRLSVSDQTRIQTLKEMVERQEKFVVNMANILWFRSPALAGTLERAIVRYSRFLAFFKDREDANKMPLVPTLDIDLVWHTHLCSPALYQAGCKHFAGRDSINHDDTLAQALLNDGFVSTARMYEIRFREEYNACLCWPCEALRSELGSMKKANGEVDFAAIAKKVQEDVEYYQVVELARRTGKPLPAKRDVEVL
ncbi:hypothetical protein B0T26DRAFT_640760 [Lasiosphaeria miniovina]|uniref:Uncharacterized protein n=1 Tax=Lasiosphaeria miniovina TaxID=1954250 RepID=A0AA40AV72_9PEZI|nr:uncharacterized protein B0T26DRAFT_640760 [Lasiosphaeria miniovina]KAK0722627.1 hypothetical protein B0T26DRAFT_640760 [Lasiosphaeria miniovina]